MGRKNYDHFKVGDGPNEREVGYSYTERKGADGYTYYGVRFVGPDGKRVEKLTRQRKRGKHPDANFRNDAAKIIARAYASHYPDPKRVTWDGALDAVERGARDLRPATMVAYRKAVKVFRETIDGTKGPADVTPDIASRFGGLFLAGTYKRGKASDAREYDRKPTTLAFHLRQLSALWKQFIGLGYVQENPWKSSKVRRPQTDRVRKPVPTEDQVNEFFAWVRGRYPEWERLHALLELKALSGCRTQDLCQLRSEQLRDGRVVWTADQTKQRQGRAVLVPASLFDRLRRLAGPAYLWEHFPADLKRFRPSKNRPSGSFDPMTVYWVVGNVFREYAEAHPDRPRLSPHSFRRRAITLVATATQSVDATAQAIGLNPSTARGYYLDAQRAFDADEVFRRAAGLLIPGGNGAGE